MGATGWVDFLKVILEKPQHLSMALLIIILIILLFPLFLSDRLQSFFRRFIEFRERFFTYIMIIFFVALTVPITYRLTVFFENGRRQSRLERLTPKEKEILRHYIKKGSLTQCIARRWGALKALERDGVIYLINDGKKEGAWCYNIERWAYFHLKDHPDLVGVATEGPA